MCELHFEFLFSIKFAYINASIYVRMYTFMGISESVHVRMYAFVLNTVWILLLIKHAYINGSIHVITCTFIAIRERVHARMYAFMKYRLFAVFLFNQTTQILQVNRALTGLYPGFCRALVGPQPGVSVAFRNP